MLLVHNGLDGTLYWPLPKGRELKLMGKGFTPATIARLSWLRYVRPLFDADRAAAHDDVERRLRRATALRYSREERK